MVRRVIVPLLLVLSVAGLAVVLLSADDGYRVKARFQAATQVVEGNRVQVAGREVGQVRGIELTPDGQAEIELEITDDEYVPLRQGTQATLRALSLSGVVNRYVDLRLPGGEATTPMEEGEVIPASRTTSAVDLDQLFNTFDDETKKGLQRFIRGSAQQYEGMGPGANEGWRYLNPSFVASTRLFRELNRDPGELRGFLAENAKLVTDLAERDGDLSALVDRLATTTGALAREERSLSDTIAGLPPFMRRANSTFVNLRSTLDELDPLVAESKPNVPKLRAVLRELRPFAEDAGPTFRDLSALVRSPGKDNDLIELAESVPAFRDITVRDGERNGEERPGSFPTSVESLRRSREPLAYFRPYAVDFTGWLDDFSHSGIYDANGSASRVATSVNAFAAVGSQLKLVPPALRDELGNAVTRTGQINRCPGAIERPAGDRSNPYKPSPDFNCDPGQIPPGG